MLERIMGAYRAKAQENYIPIGCNLVELKDSFYREVDSYRRGEKGMTLIELLVVVGIIGALSAIAIPQLLGAREKAKKSACEGMYITAQTELGNRLENTLEEGGNSKDAVRGFLAEYAEEDNPYNKEEHAYDKPDVAVNPDGSMDITFKGKCVVQVAALRRNGIFNTVGIGQKYGDTPAEKRTFRIGIN